MFEQTLYVNEFIRAITSVKGSVVSDTIFTNNKHLARRYDCSRAGKIKKCLKRLAEKDEFYRKNIHEKRFYKGNIWQDRMIYAGSGMSRRQDLILQRTAATYLSQNAAIFEGKVYTFLGRRGENPKPIGNRKPDLTAIGPFETPRKTHFDFRKIEGGRAKIKLARLEIWEEVERPAYLTDSRYAGDVQRCIVEVRNSMRADRTTGNVLSGIASVLGAGNVSRAISTANNASTTWDNLSGAERTKVDACMKRKGHD